MGLVTLILFSFYIEFSTRPAAAMPSVITDSPGLMICSESGPASQSRGRIGKDRHEEEATNVPGIPPIYFKNTRLTQSKVIKCPPF